MTGFIVVAAGAAAAAGVVMKSDEDGFEGSAPVDARLPVTG
jgi:hypothetical protein